MAKRVSGLGKGLDSLIPVPSKEDMKKAETMMKISQVEPNREQPRKNFEEESLQELAESIKQYGVIQPLIVHKKDDYYEIIAGERRWRAAKMAGLKEIPVIIKEYSSQEIMEISLIENIQREDLNPIEEAKAYQRLIKEYNLTQEEVAKRVSKSRTQITNTMRLLKLTEEVQNMLIEDLISSGHARALVAVDDEKLQLKLAQKIESEALSVRETETLVKEALNPTPVREKKENSQAKEQEEIIYRETEKRLENILGSKVYIHKKKGEKGKIEISYFSMEELERIIDLITGIK